MENLFVEDNALLVKFISSELIDESFTQYRFSIETGNFKWYINKRYSDFYSFYNLLEERKYKKLPKMPEKHLFKLREEVIKEREREFEKILKALFNHKAACKDSLLYDFIDLNKYVTILSKRKYSEVDMERRTTEVNYLLTSGRSISFALSKPIYLPVIKQVQLFLHNLHHDPYDVIKVIDNLPLNYRIIEEENIYYLLFFGDSSILLRGLVVYIGHYRKNKNGSEKVLVYLASILDCSINENYETARDAFRKGPVELLVKARLWKLTNSKNEQIQYALKLLVEVLEDQEEKLKLIWPSDSFEESQVTI